MTSRILARSRPARRWLVRLGILAATVAVSLFTLALPAAAHIGVFPDGDASAGSRTKLTFRVPNESPDSSTVAVTFSLPTDHPLPTVSVLHQPGWTAELATVTLDPPVTEGNFTLEKAVSSVTFTAEKGAGVGPGEFAEFAILVGPIPDVDSLAFPAKQVYSDGTVVDWDQPPNADGSEPDDPAPALTVTPESAVKTGDVPSPSSDPATPVLSLAALVVAAVAMLMAAVAIRKRPSRSGGQAKSGDDPAEIGAAP